MTQPLVQAITIVRGDTKTWVLTLERNAAPVAFPAGTKMWFTAKNSLLNTDADALIKLDTVNTVSAGTLVLTSTTAGTAELTLKPEATSAFIPPVTLQYDIQLKENDGTISTVVVGTLAITPDATQRTTT